MSAPIFHDEPPNGPISELGRYARLAEAREHGLVIASMEKPHWILRQGREYALCVLEADRDAAAAALADFVREETSRPAPVAIEPLRIPRFATLMVPLLMAACYSIQSAMPAWAVERGVADDLRIQAGEWWRTFTALTLHGDAEHLVSNISLAIFVFAFVFARFGAGAGTLAILLGGALGNALNAVAHVAQAHRSIGSSTALFAGIGLLAGSEVVARIRRGSARGGWPLLVPLGAGLAFLSMYGGAGLGEDGKPAAPGNVDVMAHLFGLLAGLVVGAIFHSAGLRCDARTTVRAIAGSVTAALLALTWWMALK